METVYDLNIICFACTTSNREKAKMGRSNTGKVPTESGRLMRGAGKAV